MCVYDFDFMCEIAFTGPWDPSMGRCDCRSDLTGRTVTVWEGAEVTADMCALARRSVFGGFADDDHRECGHCNEDGESVIYHRFVVCDRCSAAGDILNDWCDGQYEIGRIPDQLHEHWFEDTLFRSLAFGRILWGATHGWRDRAGNEVPVEQIKAWADKAREVVKAR